MAVSGKRALLGEVEIVLLRAQNVGKRTQRRSSWSIGGAASASRTAFGAWPGVMAKVVDGVSAMSRRAAAATKVCERQCVRQRQPEMIGLVVRLDLEACETFGRDLLAALRRRCA